jgi:twitching motility protein PilI
MPEAPLAELRERPFELLREMERRAWRFAVEEGEAAGAREWVGIGFKLGGQCFLAPREEVREVMACPPGLARVPGTKPWVAGMANLRGQLLVVVDFQAFLGGAATRIGRDTRILVINHRELGAGLLVDEVLGFRRFPESARSAVPEGLALRCERYLDGAFSQPEQPWPVFSLTALGESPEFMKAALDG